MLRSPDRGTNPVVVYICVCVGGGGVSLLGRSGGGGGSK